MSTCSKGVALVAAAFLLSVAVLAQQSAIAEEPEMSSYPAVQDVPRPTKPAMTVDEQSKLKNDLSAVRDRQTTAGKSKGKAPAKP